MDSGGKTISQLAALYGLTLRTLRFYEDLGLLQPMRRGTTRFYTTQDEVRLKLILKGRRLGFKLSEIQQVIAKSSPDLDEVEISAGDLVVHLGRNDIARQIEELEARRTSLDEAIRELKQKLA